MVQKKKRLTKTQRLLNAWAMRLANQLTEDYGLTQSNALRRAHMTAAVLDRLGKGDGKHRDNSNTEGIYTYWDLERHAFRTFKAINLIE